MPPPTFLKHEVLRGYAKTFGIKTFVETGTYKGSTIFALRDCFDTLYSVELSEILYKKALQRFKNDPKVHLFQGDSGEKLAEIVKLLDAPALFWLDGHYSGGETAKGDKETPIRKELKTIFDSHFPHVVIIDDAREFLGTHDYPELSEIASLAREHNYSFLVENDSIRLAPIA